MKIQPARAGIAALCLSAACLSLSGCGGDDGASPSTATIQVGGSVSGLSAAGLVLANGSDTLAVASGATTFTMPKRVDGGASYAITISAQPAGATCLVQHGTGVVPTAGVTTVAVHCGPTWSTRTMAGGDAAGAADGTGASATFNAPDGLAPDDAGNLFVTDTGNGLIRKIGADGTVSTYAGQHDADGNAAPLQSPRGPVVDNDGNLVFANHDGGDVKAVSAPFTIAEVAPPCCFQSPSATALDRVGRIIFLTEDTGTLWGAIGPERAPEALSIHGLYQQLFLPNSLGVDAAGNVYVTQASCTLVKVLPTGLTLAVPGGDCTFGAPAGTLFNASLTVASDGTLFIADPYDKVVRRLGPDGTLTIVAGSVGVAGHADGAAATFDTLTSIALDRAGNLYVTDGNRIRKLTPPAGTAPALPAQRLYALGGTLSGDFFGDLVLANGSDTIHLGDRDYTFKMPTGVPSGTAYAVTVASQPSDATCVVDQGSGVVDHRNITSVSVTCSAHGAATAAKTHGD